MRHRPISPRQASVILFRAKLGLVVLSTVSLVIGSVPSSAAAMGSEPTVERATTHEVAISPEVLTGPPALIDQSTPPPDRAAPSVATQTQTSTEQPTTQPNEPTTQPTAPNAPAGHDPGANDEPTDHQDPGSDSSHGGPPSRLSCAAIDPTWVELELGGHPVSGVHTVTDAFRTVQITVLDADPGGKVVDWTADGPIDAVILRSGQDAATYEYEPAALGASGLLPPLKDREGRNLASILVCYDPAEATVDIDLFLADSEDPVEVGDPFDYLVEVSTSNPLTEAEVVLVTPAEVSVVEAPGCTVDAATIRCAPPLDAESSWQGVVTVKATAAGNAIARAELRAMAADEPVVVSAVEVTRIIGKPGSSDGCGGHDEGGEDPGHDASDDECPGAAKALVTACEALHPSAVTVVLPGPFASREYVLEGADGARILVTISESTGVQTAAWESTVPIDAAFSRTGQDVAEFLYDPAALSGTGIVGPPSGSGKPRPMADLAFCFVPRPAVDIRVAAAGPASLTVGDAGRIEVSIRNVGYATAEAILVKVATTPHVVASTCPDLAGCPIDDLDPGGVTVLSLEVNAVKAGVAMVVIEVVVPNEPTELAADNVFTVTFPVSEVKSATQERPATGAELPATGPPISGILVVWAVIFLLSGASLLRTAARLSANGAPEIDSASPSTP